MRSRRMQDDDLCGCALDRSIIVVVVVTMNDIYGGQSSAVPPWASPPHHCFRVVFDFE
jgi:hypothetical protein